MQKSSVWWFRRHRIVILLLAVSVFMLYVVTSSVSSTGVLTQMKIPVEIMYDFKTNVSSSHKDFTAAKKGIFLQNTILKNNETFEAGFLISPIVSSQRIPNYSNVKRKLILLWSPLFEGWNFLPLGSETFEESHCPETRCEVTDDRNRLKQSDAVVFHVRTFSITDVPLIRYSRQKWVFLSLEAPPHSFFSGFPFMFKMFNWTMTYKHDSDVIINYGLVRRNLNKLLPRNQTILDSSWKDKSKMAVWMVSHCSTPSNREGYVRELQNHMDVDILGGCGIGVCPHNKTDKCLENFAKKYKFLLAFENAICDDYVTEKFFRALKYDIIPVVFGGANYTRIAPPHSYVDALEYASPKQLANYLHKVSRNDSLYYEYLEWKEKGYDIQEYSSHCELCRKLHSKEFDNKTVYADITKWWVKNSHCKRWEYSK